MLSRGSQPAPIAGRKSLRGEQITFNAEPAKPAEENASRILCVLCDFRVECRLTTATGVRATP
jgi:hypothetical protein